MPRKEAPLLVEEKNQKADNEYPFEHGEVTTNKQASFLNQLPERKETTQGFHHEANGDFKTVTECNGCDRRKLKMDQQY